MLAADCSCSGGDAASVWRLPGAAPMEDLDLEFSEPTESARCNDLNPRGLCATFCAASDSSKTPCRTLTAARCTASSSSSQQLAISSPKELCNTPPEHGGDTQPAGCSSRLHGCRG